ncbi:MAG: hypothetical protein JW942_06220 [Opitutales bacterium]|nr:hypothetical protein [Opitutales bacterium]
MLSARTKGIFVEKGLFRTMVAVTSSSVEPFVIEKLEELPGDMSGDLMRERMLALFEGGKNARYASCFTSVFPQGRFFLRHSVETPVKLKEAGFFDELLRSMGVDVAQNSVGIINAADGRVFDPSRNLSAQRELMICGAPVAEFKAAQEDFLASGIFPERMELGSLSMLGSLTDYARFASKKKPVLYLELGLASCSLFIVSAERVDLCRVIPHGIDSMLPVLGQELGVTDAASARNLLFSNTFDFTEMGPTLLGKLLREMRASTGFYEVQTGQSIGSVVVHLIPQSLDWTRLCIARSLGLELMEFNYADWLASRKVNPAPGLNLGALHQGWIGVLGMMPDFSIAAS